MGRKVVRYKYKNIALALAVMLLIVLSIVSACSAKEEDVTPAPIPPQKEEPTFIEKPTITNYKVTGLDSNIKYWSVRNSYQLETGDLILVNGACRYRGKPAELVGNYNYLFNAGGERIGSTASTLNLGCKRMLEAFGRMLEAFNQKTRLTTIMLSDIHLNEAEQKECMEHDTGLAVDLRLYYQSENAFPPFTGEGEYGWFAQNCYSYGFILRYPENKEQYTGVTYKPEHFRYIGLPHSEIIRDKALCLEEYIDWLTQFTIADPYSYRDRDGRGWAVYYVKQSTDTSTNIPIPLDENGAEYGYMISGDNRSGFIVTVDMDSLADS